MPKRRKPPAQTVKTRLRRLYQRTYIREWRELRGMSQEALADQVGAYLAERGLAEGYTHATIGRLERGLVRYTQPVMEAIADALRTTVPNLIAVNPAASSFAETENGQGREMGTIWNDADPLDRSKILSIARTLVGKTGTDGR